MKNIKFIPFALSALVAAPALVSAQTQTASARVAKAPQEPMPKAQELFDNLFAPYAAAKTFSGNFDISIKGNQNAFSEMHIKTLFAYNDKGIVERQAVTWGFVETANPEQKVVVRFANKNGVPILALDHKKTWATIENPEPDAVPFLNGVLKPLLDGFTQALDEMPGFVPVISRGTDAGRPVFILKAKGSNVLKVVVDSQTRALRSFDLLDSISVLGSNQTFNQPISEKELEWTPPADFKQVRLDELEPPAFLNMKIGVKPAADTVTPTE